MSVKSTWTAWVTMVGSIKLYDWSVRRLLRDFPAYSHQCVVKSGFHLYSLYTHIQYISAPPQHTHTTLTEPDYAHSWGIGDFLISPQNETQLCFCPQTLMCALCVSHSGFTHCLILFRNVFKYVSSVLTGKDASSELCLETIQCSKALHTHQWGHTFSNRQLDFILTVEYLFYVP